jgi:hypothetical protein
MWSLTKSVDVEAACSLASLLFLFLFDYRFTLIGTTIHAYMMRKDGFVTLRAK